MKVWLSNLHCTGKERSVMDCPRELNYELDEYDHSVGVECTNGTSNASGEWLAEHN